MLYETDPLYYRCLVEVFRAWYEKTREPPIEGQVGAISGFIPTEVSYI